MSIQATVRLRLFPRYGAVLVKVEKFLREEFGFKKGFRAFIQTPEGMTEADAGDEPKGKEDNFEGKAI